ncbi:TATA element modulatory factor 1 DNA binding-domain-containing protein [Phlyctochytrium arcticum]|nr:TATA element modulatory factor 1 DNA binding-domain-containing protein [Phlyctochytrium arcticum]
MSWLSSFANAENAAALFKQAVSTVESKIDQVLDIPGSQQPTQSSPSSQPGTSPSSPKVRDPGRSPRLGASSPSPKRASNTQQPSNPQPPSKSRTGSTDKGPRLNIHDRLSALAATKAANSSSQPPIKAGPSATQSPIPANVPAEPSPIAPSTIASKPESPLVELTDSPPKIDPAHVPLPTSSSSDPAVGWGLSPLEQEVSNVNLSEPLVANGHVTSQGVGPEVVAQPSTDPAETPSATETRLQVDESGPSRVVNTVLEWSSSPSLPEGSMQATDTQAGEVEISSEDLQRAISTRLPNESPSEESLAALAGEETLPASIQLVPDASSERNTKAASEADHIIPEMPTSAAEPVASSGKDSQLQVILEQREHQLMRSMQDNATLTDSLVSLKARVERMEEERQLEANEYEERIASLTEHNADLEQKIAISAKLNVEELAAKLEQKEELVAQLMSEGEKLSKAEFKANTTVKKLRAEKGDLEKQIKDLTAKIDGSAVETNALQIKLQHAQDSERKTQEASKSYKDAHERQSKELSKAQAELATVRSREGELEATLQRVRDELAEVRRLDHQTRSAAASEALAEQTKVVEELRGKLDASDRELERVQVAAQRERFPNAMKILPLGKKPINEILRLYRRDYDRQNPDTMICTPKAKNLPVLF